MAGKASAADEAAGERFALADDSKTVVVLAGSLSKQLVAAPLGFRDRTLARFVDTMLQYGTADVAQGLDEDAHRDRPRMVAH